MALEYFGEEQIRDLVTRLTRVTITGQLQWAQNDNSDFSFVTSLPTSIITLTSRDRDDLAPHILAVFTHEPKLLQEIDSSHLNAPLADDIADLYLLIKRKTLKLDAVARQILDDLDKLGNEPPF